MRISQAISLYFTSLHSVFCVHRCYCERCVRACRLLFFVSNATFACLPVAKKDSSKRECEHLTIRIGNGR